MRDLTELTDEIKDNVEWLETTQGDEVECISIENLERILADFFDTNIDLSQD